MNHVYKVPIIPQNLSKQETIVQIAEVLNHLLNVTEDMLNHINNRVDMSQKRLSVISERISEANKKIMKLSGAKKATQVFSSCKYPATDINQPFMSIFDNVKPPEIVRHKLKYKKLTASDEPSEKLHIYHVKVKGKSKETVNGLGDIPSDIDSVSDLLLYNSGKNLYRNFVISDALDVSQGVLEQEMGEDPQIGAAPHSISDRSNLTRSSTQNYFYAPNLGEVPAIDVPLDLPDLPNIADDLRYNIEMDQGIAPSITTTPNIPDLPVIETTKDDLDEIEIELPAPPPLEPPEPEPQETMRPPSPPKIDKITEKPTKLPELPQLDIRASLMEAIRSAGGSKNLKSAAKPEVIKPVAGGDLMADLHAKLSMRRKGISGTKKPEMVDAGSALAKMSALIPPPVAKPETNDNAEDEDWDD